MNKFITLLRRYWPSLLTLGVVLYATLTADPLDDTTLPPIPHLDKLIHAVMMGGLYGAVIFDRQRSDKTKSVDKRFRITLAYAIAVFCILDEIAQASMGLGRSGDPLDLIADWSGIAVAYFTAPPAVRSVLHLS